MSKMNEFYKGVLSAGGLKVTDENYVSVVAGDVELPFTVDQKRLILPTQELQRRPPENTVFFHPLRENAHQVESPVMSRFRHAVTVNMNYLIQHLMADLMSIAASPALHTNFGSTQLAFLDNLPGNDAKSYSRAAETFASIIKGMDIKNTAKAFVNIFLKRRAKVGDKEYSRGAIVSFPLYEEFVRAGAATAKDDKKVFGVTVSNKDREIMMAVMRCILPHIDTKGHYDVGSDSNLAPYLCALLEAYLKLIDPITAMAQDFHEFISKPALYEINEGWVETFGDLGVLLGEVRATPLQPGNEGGIHEGVAKKFVDAPPSKPKVSATYETPVEAEVEVSTEGKVDTLKLLKERQAKQQPYNSGPNGAWNNGWGNSGWGQQQKPKDALQARQDEPRWLNDGAPAWNADARQGGGWGNNTGGWGSNSNAAPAWGGGQGRF